MFFRIKIALRDFVKHKRFYIISIFGLAVGIAVSCLLWFHISYEKNYDKFYKSTDDLYRVSYNMEQNGKQLMNSARTPSALVWALAEEIEGVEAATQVYYESSFMYTDKVKLHDQHVLWADSSFFSVFQLEMIAGNPTTALENSYTIVISDKIAQTYFGDEDPIDKIIKLNQGFDLTVTGVFKALPTNCHLKYDILGSFTTINAVMGTNKRGSWGSKFVSTYIRKNPNAGQSQIENSMALLVDKYMADRKAKGQEIQFSLMPVQDIYLFSDLQGEFFPTGSNQKIILLSLIASNGNITSSAEKWVSSPKSSTMPDTI